MKLNDSVMTLAIGVNFKTGKKKGDYVGFPVWALLLDKSPISLEGPEEEAEEGEAILWLAGEKQ